MVCFEGRAGYPTHVSPAGMSFITPERPPTVAPRPIVRYRYLCREALTAWLESLPVLGRAETRRANIRALLALDASDGLDDVELQSATTTELKHLLSTKRRAVLSNRSTDFWKTLRVWGDWLQKKQWDPLRTRLAR